MTDRGTLPARPEPHPATAKAWSWFEEQQGAMTYDRRERIALALAAMDAELWKLDHAKGESDASLAAALRADWAEQMKREIASWKAEDA